MTAIKKDVTIGDCRLILGDCLEVMPLLGKVDAVVTSPPYDNLRTYGDDFQGVDLLRVIEAIAKLLPSGGVCMWNVADGTKDGSETGSSFRQALHAIDCGLRLHDTMIYVKDSISFPESVRYHAAHEYMFVFSKGAPATFNPIIDRVNKWAGTTMHGTGRQPDGRLTQISGKKKPIGPLGMRYNWWILHNKGGDCGHPAVMPMSMATGHVGSWSNTGDTILDPFMGSGTTLVACAKMGRKGIGIELDPDYFEIACRRVEEVYRQPDLFVQQPKPTPAQEVLDI